MIAKSFRSVGWVASVAVAALGCYMLSLQVAAERAELAGIERRIIGTQQAIRSLQTELGTRGRMQQLEQWNADVLALAAPVSGQYLENEVQLASLQTGRPTPLDQAGEVRHASAETAPAAQPIQPQVRMAAARTPAPAPRAEAEAQPLVRRASLSTVPADPAPRAAVSRPAPRTAAAPAAAKPAPARTAAAAPTAVRAASLLDERTTRAIREAARAERPGGDGERSRATSERSSRSRGE